MAELSDYERMRVENLQRNQKFLEEIGLSPNQKSRTVASKNKMKRNGEYRIVQIGSRKSSRLAELETVVNYKEEPRISDHRSNNNIKEINTLEAEQSAIEIDNYLLNIAAKRDSAYDLKRKRTSEQHQPLINSDSGSSRVLNAKLESFLNENSFGKRLDSYGKLPVMALANGGSAPRFNKYSGVVEWSNCIFLWVNVGGTGPSSCTQYNNAFSDGGRCMRWYGGSKMSRDSPVIQRLVGIARSAAAGNVKEAVVGTGSYSDGSGSSYEASTVQVKQSRPLQKEMKDDGDGQCVLLFIRIEGEPYCCLGRLSLVNCMLDKSPVQFLFRLMDYDNLVATKSGDVDGGYFADILRVTNR